MQESLFTSNFKKNIKFFIKVSIFLVLLIPAIKFIGKKYSVASTENLINSYNQKRFEEFYSLPENTLDLVFLGSSHSYCTFDPEIFDNELGISSYQMGMPLQNPNSTYYTLLEVLNYQKPSAVVMEVYWGVLEDDFELNQVKSLFQVLENENLKQDYMKNFPLAEQVKYNINLFKFQLDYFSYKGNDIQTRVRNKFNLIDTVNEKQVGIEEYRSKGYTFCNYNMLESEFDSTNQFKDYDGKDWEFSDVQKKYLQKIIDICKDNDIELIFVTAPIANVSMEYIKNYDVIYNKIKNFADENEIFYIDYNLENLEKKLLTNDNFRDDAHLNHSGVEIISNEFAQVLKNYNIF